MPAKGVSGKKRLLASGIFVDVGVHACLGPHVNTVARTPGFYPGSIPDSLRSLVTVSSV